MRNLAKPNLDEVLLDHELDFISDSSEEEFKAYLADEGTSPDSLTKQFDSAVAQLSKSSVHTSSDFLAHKRSQLEELLKHATTLGLSIDLTLDDIPNMDEEDLDLCILRFSSPSDIEPGEDH